VIPIAFTRRALRTRSALGASRQKGVVLFIALIVLVALMLASISLVRSVDTANVIAGNLAFKQTTVQAADYGIEAAATALPDIIKAADTLVTPTPTGGPNYWYYPTRRETDAYGVPTQDEAGSGGTTPIDWRNVPVAAAVAGNDVQVVIERLCRGAPPVASIAASCFYEGATPDDSKDVGAFHPKTHLSVYYRVTSYVTGPRNTVSIVQAVISR
jgi:type IV pilus assembly protein PilX